MSEPGGMDSERGALPPRDEYDRGGGGGGGYHREERRGGYDRYDYRDDRGGRNSDRYGGGGGGGGGRGGEEDLGRIYVKGVEVGRAITKEDLIEAFNTVGEVTDGYVSHDKGFGFIRFRDPEHSRDAIDKFNDQELKGFRINVEVARKPNRDRRDGGRDFRIDTKPGDWLCPSCGVNNFARRERCFRCQVEKPMGGGGGGYRGEERRPPPRGRSPRGHGGGYDRGGYMEERPRPPPERRYDERRRSPRRE